MSVAFDPFDTETIRGRIAAFIAGQGVADVAVGPLRRFTVGFSWVTFGLRASWRDAYVTVERDLILAAGPPNGLFGRYLALPESPPLRRRAVCGAPLPTLSAYPPLGCSPCPLPPRSLSLFVYPRYALLQQSGSFSYLESSIAELRFALFADMRRRRRARARNIRDIAIERLACHGKRCR